MPLESRKVNFAPKILLPLSAFVAFVIPLLVPILAGYIASDLRTSVTAVGYLAGLQNAVVGGICLFAGPLSDRIGRKRVLIAALLMTAVMTALLAASRDVLTLYVAGTLCAIAYGPIVLCALAYAGEYYAGTERGAMVGLISGMVYAGVIVGVPVSILLTEGPGFGWRVAFIAIAGTATLAGVACSRLPALPNSTSRAIQQNPLSNARAYIEVLRDPAYRRVIVMFVLTRLGVGMYLTYGMVFLFVARDLPPSSLTLIYPAGGMIALITSTYAGALATKKTPASVVLAACALLVTAILLIVHVPTNPATVVPIMFGICVLYMFAEALRMGALHTEAVAEARPENRGTYLGAVTFVNYLSTALGAILGGLIVDFVTAAERTPREGIDVGFELIVYVAATLWLMTAAIAASAVVANRRVSSRPSV